MPAVRIVHVARRIGLATALTAVLLVPLAGSVQAAGVYDRYRFADVFEDVACDAGYAVAGTITGMGRTLEPTPAEPEFFRFQSWWVITTVVSNEETGASFTERIDVGFREHSIERLDPGSFEYRYRTTEQVQYQIRDGAGKLVYREQGTSVFEYVFDAVGDGSYGELGGIYLDIAEIENTFNPDFDFCGLADELIG